MDGDLNLSQALGGLRIANATPPASPRHRPDSPASSVKDSESLRNSIGGSSLRQQLDRNDSEERVAEPHSASVSRQNSTARTVRDQPTGGFDDRQQQRPFDRQDLSRPYDFSPQFQNPGRNSYMGPQPRPNSSFLPYQNYGPPQSAPPHNAYPQYTGGISREPSRSSVSGASRHSQRDRPIPDRSYRQSAPIGHFPPRGSSRGMGQVSNGYGGKGGGSGGGGGVHPENHPLASSEEWKEKGAAIGYKREFDQNGKPITTIVKKGVKDFTFGRTLGEGSYSTVLAATDRTTLREYAVKVLDKRHIIKENKVKYVNIEKDTLNRLGDHPGIVKLYYTFQDERNLYFVLDLATGGELLGFLKKIGSFDEECTRFYGAQILDAIEYMHSKNVIHRDLKPENVLLDDQMHVKITDFGTAKILDPPKKPPPTSPKTDNKDNQPDFHPENSNKDAVPEHERANSFVGTAEYVSPELLTEKSACKASDLWAFGCIIYQLLAGRPPFKAANEYLTFQKIVALEYEFPRGFPPLAKDLVERLLVLDPAHRLTIEHIKNHEFFRGIEWGRRLWKQKAPRLKAYIPPPPEEKIIKLNEFSGPPPIYNYRNGLNGSNNSLARPAPPLRVITELPPPSQLDIEWSPVLTRPNERILKLGNCMVQSSHHSGDSKTTGNGSSESKDTPNKLARFFSAVGSNTKRRQRLVMITSSARILIAQAGGEEKKIKAEINLLAPGVSVRSVASSPDGKIWAVETKEKRYTFEDMKSQASEWLDSIERARQFAMAFPENSRQDSNLSSPTNTISEGKDGRKDKDEKSSKRFSKRASKHGLGAVF